MHIGLLDHRRQRLLGQPRGLQEGWEVGALAELRDRQLDAPDPRLPGSGDSRFGGSAARGCVRARWHRRAGRSPAPSAARRRTRASRRAGGCHTSPTKAHAAPRFLIGCPWSWLSSSVKGQVGKPNLSRRTTVAAKRPARASLRYAKAPLSPRYRRKLHQLPGHCSILGDARRGAFPSRKGDKNMRNPKTAHRFRDRHTLASHDRHRPKNSEGRGHRTGEDRASMPSLGGHLELRGRRMSVPRRLNDFKAPLES